VARSQVVKEVRHIYSFAIIETATRLGRLVFEQAGSMHDIIVHTSAEPVFGEPHVRGVRPTNVRVTPLSCLQQTLDGFLQGVRSVLEDKAFVALTRGLWDFVGNEAYRSLNSLADGRENPVRDGCKGWGGRVEGSGVRALLASAGRVCASVLTRCGVLQTAWRTRQGAEQLLLQIEEFFKQGLQQRCPETSLVGKDLVAPSRFAAAADLVSSTRSVSYQPI